MPVMWSVGHVTELQCTLLFLLERPAAPLLGGQMRSPVVSRSLIFVVCTRCQQLGVLSPRLRGIGLGNHFMQQT
jgi:hypothetical protein